MKETLRNVSVLVPSSEKSQIPSLGYTSLHDILAQAFPSLDIQPIHIDNSSGLRETDIFIANLYSTLGFLDLMNVLNEQGFRMDKKEKPFTTIAGGTGVLNALPVKGVVDYVTFNEENLVGLVSQLTGREPRSWRQSDPIWAKTDYITLIMPTLSCIYKCVFCPLKNQNDGKLWYSPVDKVKKILSEKKPNRVLIHSASILQHPSLDELLRVLDESQAAIYLGSMNLIDIDEQKAQGLRRLNPKHTLASENDTDVELYFGLETGSSRILRAMKKPLTREIVTQKVQILRNAGFQHLGFYLILGYPNTEERDFIDTADILNTIADIMGTDGKISIKCTPFIPHLATEVSQAPARYWFECVRELNFIKSSARSNIRFDISDAFYYLTSIVFIRGGKDHSRLLQAMLNKDIEIKSDEDMDELLQELNLPNLHAHLHGKAPLDLSFSSKPFVKTEDL